MRAIDIDYFINNWSKQHPEIDLYDLEYVYKEDFEKLPIVEAEPVITAKWEQAYNGYVCSNCHSRFTINTMGAGEFCSKCGAKMAKINQFNFSNLKIEGE